MSTKPEVLVVDDDHEFAGVLCRWLTGKGFGVTELHDPGQAMQAASENSFAVAVLDRSLPGCDGFQLMLMLRAQFADLQVVFLSGHSGEAERSHALAHGAFAYLTKPCRLGEIQGAIERAAQVRQDALHLKPPSGGETPRAANAFFESGS